MGCKWIFTVYIHFSSTLQRTERVICSCEELDWVSLGVFVYKNYGTEWDLVWRGGLSMWWTQHDDSSIRGSHPSTGTTFVWSEMQVGEAALFREGPCDPSGPNTPPVWSFSKFVSHDHSTEGSQCLATTSPARRFWSGSIYKHNQKRYDSSQDADKQLLNPCPKAGWERPNKPNHFHGENHLIQLVLL